MFQYVPYQTRPNISPPMPYDITTSRAAKLRNILGDFTISHHVIFGNPKNAFQGFGPTEGTISRNCKTYGKMEQHTVYDSDTTATDLESNDVALYPRSSPPTSLEAPISPPPLKRRKTALESDRKTPPRPETDDSKNLSHLAAIEAGEARIEDHVQYFSGHLSRYVREREGGLGVMRNEEWMDLYRRNKHAGGRHFVVHQHDHPVAGGLSAFRSFILSLGFLRFYHSYCNLCVF